MKKKINLFVPVLAGAFILANSASAQLWTAGHGDIGVALEDDDGPGGNPPEFHLHAHLHSGAVVDGSPLVADQEYDAAGLTINVPLLTKISAPANAALSAGTGAATGEDLWILPQNNPGSDPIPFLGLATEELVPGDWSTDITFTLGAVSSPSGSGEFSVWQPDGIGGFNFFFATADQSLTVNGDDTLDLGAGVHDHFNYGFTEAGSWTVELTASGTHIMLGALSDTQTFSFNVVPEPSAFPAIAGLFVLALVVLRRRNH